MEQQIKAEKAKVLAQVKKNKTWIFIMIYSTFFLF
jgi:hypothetical protein